MSDVTKTNDHASNCKAFAVSLGYYEDPFIKIFARNPERKPPEISLGTYVRAMVVRLVVSEFISIYKRRCNLVSLGAGFDTLFWNLALKPEKYVEVDLKDVVMRKTLMIQRSPQLKQALSKDAKVTPGGVTSENFFILSLDLSNPESALHHIIETTQLDTSLPILFLSECVLIYLDSQTSQKLIDTIPKLFKSACFLLYEQVNVKDRFGQIMMENIRSTWCSGIGDEACVSLMSQEQRFSRSGDWKLVKANLTSTLAEMLPGYHKVFSIEKLDEEELLQQLLTHYCFLFAASDANFVHCSELNYIKQFFIS